MRKFLLYMILIVAISWLAGLVAFAYTINHYQIDMQSQTEAIVVLTGGRNRISEGARLLDQGLAKKLFISGVEKNTSLKAISQKQDINFSKSKEVALDKKSTNTIENAIETQAWLQQNQIQSIRLVTSNYHIPRSMVEFGFQNPDLKIVAHPVYSKYVAKDWWKSARSFSLIASEYNKFLCVYIVRNIFHEGLNIK